MRAHKYAPHPTQLLVALRGTVESSREVNQEMSGELSDFSDLREAAIRAVDSVIEDGERQLGNKSQSEICLSLCPLSSEVEDVVSTIHVDRDQMSAVWNQALVTALHTTPLKQFGIGFGVGW